MWGVPTSRGFDLLHDCLQEARVEGSGEAEDGAGRVDMLGLELSDLVLGRVEPAGGCHCLVNVGQRGCLLKDRGEKTVAAVSALEVKLRLCPASQLQLLPRATKA